MQYFKIYQKQDILSLTRIRKFETKVGERIQTLSCDLPLEEALAASTAQFVVFGVPEDIGVKANHGIGGADSVWEPFVQAFLNVQSNDFFNGDDVLVLGHFDFSAMAEVIENVAGKPEEKIEAYRHAVKEIDNEVERIVKLIAQSKKVPVVIGGGHNNAYPCIKGTAKGLYKAGLIPLAQINAINLDAHADFRATEGRHSGNGFRYADEDGFLEKYCVVGLHENYITQNTWIDIVNDPFVDIITFEDIFLRGKRTFVEAVEDAINFTGDTWYGVELDLDSIENILCSDASPVGINTLFARKYIHMAATEGKAAYLHICEGATAMADGRKNMLTGKLVSYLVTDFIKAMQGGDE